MKLNYLIIIIYLHKMIDYLQHMINYNKLENVNHIINQY